MGTTDPIIGYSQKITELTSKIKQCDDDVEDAYAVIENLKQRKADLTKERDTIITVLKEFLAQPLSVADLDDDM
jgi:hypothetical protein|nr:MAG TPA: hypothetical protein [Caudoviricetes sp.]